MKKHEEEIVMRRFLFYTALVAALLGGTISSRAETIRVLMETVPDTTYIEKLLPEFTEATGIDVEIEAISYIDMHTKLVPQLISQQGSYDVIIVDFYWVGEFTKAGWLLPLDDYVERDGIDLGRYVPKVFSLVGQVDGVTYMLPFYNYAMGVVYRQDLLDDPEHQAAFKAKYNKELRIPETWEEYSEQIEYFTQDTDGDGKVDFFGTVLQGQRGDCISMQWSNYLFGNGGAYHNADWDALMDSPEAIQALEDYRYHMANYSPPGSESFCFDETFNVMAQGKAYNVITFNGMFAGFNDPASSKVVGKVGITSSPGGGLNGAWGWGIPKSSPDKEAAWKFINWVESFEIAKRRAIQGGAPTQSAIFTDPDVVAERPYYPKLMTLIEKAKDFPVFTYTTAFVEETGLELNLGATGQKDVAEAMKDANAAFEALIEKDGLK